MQNKIKKRGFTIIELVVVIAIMAILSFIITPNLTEYTRKADESKIQTNLQTFHVAAEMSDKTSIKFGEEGYKEKVGEFANVNGEELNKYNIYKEANGSLFVTYYGNSGFRHSFDGNKEFSKDNIGDVILATDEEFTGSKNGEFKYTGKNKSIEIPNVIKGIQITSYHKMFEGTNVQKVVSTNKNITDMSYMFTQSKSRKIDLTNLNTDSVTSMYAMFYLSKTLDLDVSKFNTSNVINMGSMFNMSKAINLDVSNFNTSNATIMEGMFWHNKSKNINLKNFNTSKVTDFSAMLGFTIAKLDVSSFDTSKATTMGSMFQEVNQDELNLSNFDMSNVTFPDSKKPYISTNYMFKNANIKTIVARSQYDADRFNASDSMPKEINVILK